MLYQTSLEDFIASINKTVAIDPTESAELVIKLFAHIRKANECGKWVEAEGVGRFHPLWYNLQKSARSFSPSDAQSAPQPETDIISKPIEKEPLLLLSHKAKNSLPAVMTSVTKHDVSGIKNDEDFSNSNEDEKKSRDRETEKKEIAAKWEERKKLHLQLDREKDIALQKEKKRQESKLARALFLKSTLLSCIRRSRVLHVPQRGDKRIYHYIAAFTALAIGIMLAVILFSHQKAESLDDTPEKASDQKPKEGIAFYKPLPVDTNIQTPIMSQYFPCTIRKGNSLYSIAETFYGNTKYWPLIYAKNLSTIRDMDKIFPDEILLIPRIPEDSTLRNELAQVYIQTYRRYKTLGKKNKAQWLLYWGRKNIDSTLFERYQNEIDPEDMKIVNDYLIRFAARNLNGDLEILH